jgi:hypothetical protein
MGTNYYLYRDVCPHCGRAEEEPLHIGKSSAGWCFSLHVTDEIPDLEAWQKEWEQGEIRNESGDRHTPAEMLRCVTERSWATMTDETIRESEYLRFYYHNLADYYEKNHAEPGPNGLTRHKIGEVCIGHGAGTWDLIPGEFS